MSAVVQILRTDPTRAGRARRARPTSALAVAALVMAGAACGDDEVATNEVVTCASKVEQASTESELQNQVELLDQAITLCSGIDALDVELARHRGLVAYDTDTFVAGRCARSSSTDVQDSAICQSAREPAEVAQGTIPPATYRGQTLDGRTVVITEDQVPFVEGKPAPIVQLVDIAAEDGCEALAQERERWATLVDDPISGDQASVYAQHADNVAAFVGC